MSALCQKQTSSWRSYCAIPAPHPPRPTASRTPVRRPLGPLSRRRSDAVAMISVADALHAVLAHAEPLPGEDVPLGEWTQPPADVSAMDGYAVRTADVADAPVCLKVIGEVAAGRPFATPIGPGEAARIFTGGLIPAGADTVVVQELANREADRVEVLKPASKGRHIRTEGLDFRRGERLFARGHRLTARDLALLAGMNHPLVTLHRRPKIALFATGDELVPPGTEPGPGQIVCSNGFALAALACQEGAAVTDLGLVGDTIQGITAAMHRARDIPADII